MECSGAIRVAEGVNLDLVVDRLNSNKIKKAVKKGAFMLFVEEHIEKWRKEGKDVSTKPKTIIQGDIEWRKLSDTEKAWYKGTKPKIERLPVSIILPSPKQEILSDLMASPEEDNHEPAMEPEKRRNSIKQLSTIFEEDEMEDSTSSVNMESSDNLSNRSKHSSFIPSNDINFPPVVHHTNAKNLKYPLRRPKKESLMAQRKLNFGSSGECENSSSEMSCDPLYTPDSSRNYIEIKSSSPIKSEVQSTSCDISPIKAEINSSNTWNFTLSEKKASIHKILKQVNDVMDDSIWNIRY